jgi:hypothetical protein
LKNNRRIAARRDKADRRFNAVINLAALVTALNRCRQAAARRRLKGSEPGFRLKEVQEAVAAFDRLAQLGFEILSRHFERLGDRR